MVAELLTETKTQNDMLTDIAEGLRPETQLRIKNISSIYFDLAVERVCRIIKKVREENHIADREATIPKEIRRTMRIREGAPLEIFTNKDGEVIFKKYSPIGEISEYVDAYAETVNNGRAYTNVQMVYDRIKIDFYHKLNQE